MFKAELRVSLSRKTLTSQCRRNPTLCNNINGYNNAYFNNVPFPLHPPTTSKFSEVKFYDGISMIYVFKLSTFLRKQQSKLHIYDKP